MGGQSIKENANRFSGKSSREIFDLSMQKELRGSVDNDRRSERSPTVTNMEITE